MDGLFDHKREDQVRRGQPALSRVRRFGHDRSFSHSCKEMEIPAKVMEFLCRTDLSNWIMHSSPSVFKVHHLVACWVQEGSNEMLRVCFDDCEVFQLLSQFRKAVESICAPFQFALSTRAGTDCVGHVVRALTDENPMVTD